MELFYNMYKQDKTHCKTFLDINRLWINASLVYPYKNEISKLLVEVFAKHLVITGSMIEGTGTCRCYTHKETIDLELDQMYWIGDIPENKQYLLQEIDNSPGYYRLKGGDDLLQCTFGFAKDVNYWKEFIMHSQIPRNAERVESIFNQIFMDNEFVDTQALKELLKIAVSGGSNVIFTGPSSCTYMNMNDTIFGTLEDVAKEICNKFGLNLPIKAFHALSVDDLTSILCDDDDDNEPGPSQAEQEIKPSIQELINLAFPRENNNINVLKLRDLVRRANEINILNLIGYVFQRDAFIPWFEIKELGYMWFDHVASYRLQFWPAIALSWFTRERSWPNQNVVDKIKSNAYSYIVPKSRKENLSSEWRISFSEAEKMLFEELNKFQSTCYFVAKLILYSNFKKFKNESESVKYEDTSVTISYDISSYLLKTLMFKLMEETSSNIWEIETLENLISIIKQLFINLEKCLQLGIMTSYFTDDINLLFEVPIWLIKKAKEKCHYIIHVINTKNTIENILPENYLESMERNRKFFRFGDFVLNILDFSYNYIINTHYPEDVQSENKIKIEPDEDDLD